MLLDYANELTSGGHDGEALQPAGGAYAYGSKIFDLKAADDVAIGEPLHVMARIAEAYTDLTSLDIELVGGSDVAQPPAGAVVLATKNKLLAALTINATFHVGIVPPGTAALRYLHSRVKTTGAKPGAGKIMIWIAKGCDMQRAGGAAGTL